MNWYIVRHADKEKGNFYNPVLRHQDEPISAKGITQAQKLTSYFSDKTIDKIYVSDYIRTRQTIEYVAQKLKMSPVADSRLNEIDNGAFEGLSDQEIQGSFPDAEEAVRPTKKTPPAVRKRVVVRSR